MPFPQSGIYHPATIGTHYRLQLIVALWIGVGGINANPLCGQATQEATRQSQGTTLSGQQKGDHSNQSFADYLNNLGLDELAAMSRQREVEKTDDPVLQFRLSYQVGMWLEKTLVAGEVSELSDGFWASRWDTVDRTTAIPKLILQKNQFAKLGQSAMQRVLLTEKANHDLLAAFSETARSSRTIEHQLQGFESQLKVESASLELSQNRELLHLCQSTIAWCSYYRWLLAVENSGQEELLAAKEGLMSLLGISAPELDGGATFRWYEGKDPLERRSLLGLALVLTAMGEFSEANTCMATLQQHAGEQMRSEFFYLQWLTVIRMRQWSDAARLEESYFREIDLAASATSAKLLNTMLNAIVSKDGNGNRPDLHRDFQIQQKEVRDTVSSLLSRLVAIGWIDLAAKWQQQTGVKIEDALTMQVLQLQNAVSELGIEGQSNQQLQPLQEKLIQLCKEKQPGVRFWAMKLLSDVYRVQNKNSEQIQILQDRWRLAWDPKEKQQLAWQIANLFESVEDRSQDAVVWFRRVLEIDADAEISALASLKMRLLESRFDSQERIRILEIATNQPDVANYASGLLISEIYQAWSRETVIARKSVLSLRLLKMLDDQIVQAKTVDARVLSILAMKVNLLEGKLLGRSKTEDSQSIDFQNADRSELLQVFDQVYLQLIASKPQRSAVDHSLINQTVTIGILTKALPYWDRQGEYEKVLRVRSEIDIERLAESRQFFVLNYSTRASEELLKTESKIESQQYPVDLKRLVELIESPTLGLGPEWQWPVAARYLNYLVASDKISEAENALEQFSKYEATSSPGYKQAVGRVWSAAKKWDAALVVWQQLTTELLEGSSDWFEAQYNWLAALSNSDNAKARLEYQKLLQLYPEAPSPWAEKISEFAKKRDW